MYTWIWIWLSYTITKLVFLLLAEEWRFLVYVQGLLAYLGPLGKIPISIAECRYLYQSYV